jgi:serine O-acetyltransferase
VIWTLLCRVREDVTAVVDADPAAKSRLEVVLCYPGLHAIWAHAVCHRLWTAGFRLTARVCSQVVRSLTGVEIHPAATIGRRVVVDHGMGVVIGETAVVGDDVHMYHGVTLGGNSPDPVKRHPTVGDGVTLGAGATVIGDVTIGDRARVGAGAVVTDDVPEASTVVGIPAERVDDAEDGDDADDADGAGNPDDAEDVDDADDGDGAGNPDDAEDGGDADDGDGAGNPDDAEDGDDADDGDGAGNPDDAEDVDDADDADGAGNPDD